MNIRTNESYIAEDIVKGLRISEYIRTHKTIIDADSKLISREIAREIEDKLAVEARKIWDRVSALLFPTLSQPFDLGNEYDYLELCVLPDIYIAEHHVLVCGFRLYIKFEPLLEAIEEEWNRSPIYPFKISFNSLTRDGRSTIRISRKRHITPNISDDGEE